MSSRWNKVWADLWSNKTRTFLTILIILAGTFAVGFTVNLAAFMNESMDHDFLSARPSEALIYTSSATDEIVEIAGRVPGVDAVEGRSISQANIIQSDGNLVAIQFTAIEDPNTLTVDLLKPARGETKIRSLNDRQILADASLAALGYRPGDIITVELSSGRQRKLKVAGYVHDVINPPYGMWSKTISAYVTPTTMEWLGGSRSLTDCWSVLTKIQPTGLMSLRSLRLLPMPWKMQASLLQQLLYICRVVIFPGRSTRVYFS